MEMCIDMCGTCLYTCLYACLYTCLYPCLYTCLYACLYTCSYTCLHTCLHTRSDEAVGDNRWQHSASAGYVASSIVVHADMYHQTRAKPCAKDRCAIHVYRRACRWVGTCPDICLCTCICARLYICLHVCLFTCLSTSLYGGRVDMAATMSVGLAPVATSSDVQPSPSAHCPTFHLFFSIVTTQDATRRGQQAAEAGTRRQGWRIGQQVLRLAAGRVWLDLAVAARNSPTREAEAGGLDAAAPRQNVCKDMRVDMCVDMCTDMRVDMCKDTCRLVRGHV